MTPDYKDNRIEKALTMYKENVSPSELRLQVILSQIPEQQNLKEGRAIRSPYRWLAFSQLVTVCAVVLMLLPSNPKEQLISANPYYAIDQEVAQFDAAIDAEDLALLASR